MLAFPYSKQYAQNRYRMKFLRSIRNQHGFLPILIVFIVLAIVSLGVYLFYQKQKNIFLPETFPHIIPLTHSSQIPGSPNGIIAVKAFDTSNSTSFSDT